jgi:hypothetical protein
MLNDWLIRGSFASQRLKEMKAMSKDPSAAEKARKAESKAEGFQKININLGSTSSSGGKGGFKKVGFRNAFAEDKPEDNTGKGKETEKRETKVEDVTMKDVSEAKVEEDGESDWYDGDDAYDPEKPTGCSVNCPCHREGWISFTLLCQGMESWCVWEHGAISLEYW